MRANWKIVGKSSLLFTAVLIGSLALSLSVATPARAQEKSRPTLKSITIGTAAAGGIFFVTGAAFAKLLEERLGIPVTASITEGSGENIRLLDAGQLELAMIAVNALYPAWTGPAPMFGDIMSPYKRQYRNMRLLGYLWVHPALFIALKDRGMTSMKDLKGKRVGVGPGPVTWDHLAGPIIEAHGIRYKNDIKRVYAGFSTMANQVRDGLLDVFYGTLGQPAVTELAASRDVVYLKWDPKAVERLDKEVPYLLKMTVPAREMPRGSFEGDEYLTVDHTGPYLVVRPDMPEADAYLITRAIFGNVQKLARDYAQLRRIAKEPHFAVQPVGDIPFHPGAIRYWKEAGLWRR
jgi:uncharacterized protein